MSTLPVDPLLTAVVLAWDQLAHTERCVQSLRDHTDVPFELIIVDNGSEPEAAAFAERAADRSVLNPSNRGFAAGMNQGLEAAHGRFVAFINNDTVLPAGWASRLLQAFDGFDLVGLVAPAVTAAGNPVTVRAEPGTDALVIPAFRELPSGVVYVMETETARALGGFAEDYGIATAEDLDLCFKVWVNGLQIVLDTRVLVEHASQATVRGKLRQAGHLYRTNRLRFVETWSAEHIDVPRLESCSADEFRHHLQSARIAATWMGRLFEERERAPIVATTDAAPDEHPIRKPTGLPGRLLNSAARVTWTALHRLVPKSLRARLFPRYKKLYYRVFPERSPRHAKAERDSTKPRSGHGHL